MLAWRGWVVVWGGWLVVWGGWVVVVMVDVVVDVVGVVEEWLRRCEAARSMDARLCVATMSDVRSGHGDRVSTRSNASSYDACVASALGSTGSSYLSSMVR